MADAIPTDVFWLLFKCFSPVMVKSVRWDRNIPNHASSTAPEEKWFALRSHILKSALANLYHRSVEGFAGLLITFKKA